ncbi:MAG: hypothetical protein WCP39_03640 [Chlamydiota bacterium]
MLFAYGDPGTGSLIWQILMALFVSGLFYVKRIYYWFQKKFCKKKNSSEE